MRDGLRRPGRRAVPRRGRPTRQDRDREPARRRPSTRAALRRLAAPCSAARSLGLCVLVAASVVEAILDRNVDRLRRQRLDLPAVRRRSWSATRSAGWLAGRCAPDAPAHQRRARRRRRVRALDPGPDRDLGGPRRAPAGCSPGTAPVLRPGQLFGHLVIAAALGMLGGCLGSRSRARGRPAPRRRATAS